MLHRLLYCVQVNYLLLPVGEALSMSLMGPMGNYFMYYKANSMASMWCTLLTITGDVCVSGSND